MTEILSVIISAAIAGLIAGVVKFVIPALKAYVKEHKDSQIWEMIVTAVKAAEQTIREPGQGQVKKEQVMKYVINWLHEAGLEIDLDRLDQMVEECVYMLNHNQ